MAEIKASVDKTSGLTTIKVTGKLEAGELTKFSEAHMDGQITNILLWDFRNAKLSSIVTDRLQRGISNWSKNTKSGDKLAFVFSSDLEFGIGRMIHAFSQIAGYKSRINIFRDVTKATEWLMESQTEQK